ncbi:MAG: InlB B-repeat-containing protein, partial [Oscillospiraceae bacterium]
SGYGIYASLIVNSGTIKATGKATNGGGAYGIFGTTLAMTDGKLSASGTKYAVYASSGIIAASATVTGAKETFNSGTTTKLTQDGKNPVVIKFTKSVSFDARNGVAIDDADIDKVTNKVTLPNAPTWNNYTFAGWYTDVDGKGTAFENKNLTDSVKVYAKWTKNGKAVLTQPLDLTGGKDLKGEGWEWDNATNTLKLFGITLNSAKLGNHGSAVGILFPNVPCTIILVDGTENTVDVSAAKNSLQSQVIYAENKLTIKTSGKGTPGELNVIAANANDAINKRDPSIGIYAGGGIDVESGNITAKAGDSGNDNSIGISTNTKDIHIKGGTVTAIGGTSGGTGMAGSFGMYGYNVQIDDGTVNATGGVAAKSTLSAGIVGYALVKLNGGTINAIGDLVAVAALTNNGLIIDDIGNVTVNTNPAKVANKNIGLTISTLVSDSDVKIVNAAIKFKPSYTGTNPFAPDATKVIKTDNSITLPTQTVTGETVEYGIDKNNDGNITWQKEPTFDTLTADTEYKFYTRVKA